MLDECLGQCCWNSSRGNNPYPRRTATVSVADRHSSVQLMLRKIAHYFADSHAGREQKEEEMEGGPQDMTIPGSVDLAASFVVCY